MRLVNPVADVEIVDVLLHDVIAAQPVEVVPVVDLELHLRRVVVVEGPPAPAELIHLADGVIGVGIVVVGAMSSVVAASFTNRRTPLPGKFCMLKFDIRRSRPVPLAA